MDAEHMSHLSDPDEWCRLHYGVDEDSSRFQEQLDEMHAALRVRLHSLEAKWDETQLANDMQIQITCIVSLHDVGASDQKMFSLLLLMVQWMQRKNRKRNFSEQMMTLQS
jgi:hypothetical protein